ncbi:MAG: hypothetical protein HP498_04390 [Nitrospira sp.]|nr:hypothetical protein [Nitrospira sp.]
MELFEGVVLSGVGVSAETLTAATLAMDTASYSTQSLVVLNLNTNQLDTIDSFSTSGAGQAWNQSSPVGISPDGATVAAGVYYYDGGFNTTRRTVRVYSRQSHEFTETDLGATDRSNIEAVGRNGEVLLSDKLRANGTTVTVVRNGSIQMQVSGVMPRLNPEATKMYVVNGGQIEERDLTNGQLRTIPVDPVDYSIQSDAMVHYRQTLNGCELVHFDMRTRQETLLAPSVPCPNESGIQDFSAVFMVR